LYLISVTALSLAFRSRLSRFVCRQAGLLFLISLQCLCGQSATGAPSKTKPLTEPTASPSSSPKVQASASPSASPSPVAQSFSSPPTKEAAAALPSKATPPKLLLEIEYPSEDIKEVLPARPSFVSGPFLQSPASMLTKATKVRLGSGKASLRQWKRACENLANYLQTGKGLYGTGVFDRVVCLKKNEPATSLWRLRVGLLEKTVEFQPNLRGQEAMEYKAVGSFRIPRAKRSLDFLLVNEFAMLVAFGIADQLPAAYLWSAPSAALPLVWLQGSSLRLNRNSQFPAPYQELAVVTASKSASFGPVPLETLKPHATVKLNGENYLANAPLAAIAPQSDPKFHAVNPAGRGARSWEIETAAVAMMFDLAKFTLVSLLSGAASDIWGILEETTANGYVAFRIGVPLGSTDGALKTSKTYGVLVIVKGGPLDGLRYTADFIPASTLENSLGTEKIDWSRHLVGYSFDYTWRIVTFDLTPKIGAWNFEYSTPLELPKSKRIVNTGVSISRRLSLGAELGAEYRQKTLALRGFAAIDRALSLSDGSDDSLVSSRLGLDLYWSGANNFKIAKVDFSPTFVSFIMRDAFTLIQAVDESAEASIADVTVESLYLGIGAALKW